MIYTSEKMLKEMGEKMKPEDKTALEEKIAALKAVKDGADGEAIKKAAGELTDLAQKIGGAMYQEKEHAGGGESKPEEKKDDSIEGEVVDKKE
jgi:molecular chaperone DnaK